MRDYFDTISEEDTTVSARIKESSTEKIINKSESEILFTSHNKSISYAPTFYEFLFFMAMMYFEEQKTEVIILETGLGGRLDATNVIDAPKVIVLTEIGMDHMEYLGDTYEKIAKEKAGIIKCGILHRANSMMFLIVILQPMRRKYLNRYRKCTQAYKACALAALYGKP